MKRLVDKDICTDHELVRKHFNNVWSSEETGL